MGIEKTLARLKIITADGTRYIQAVNILVVPNGWLTITDSDEATLAPFLIGARAYHNANQSIANASAVVLALNSERFDTDTIHDTVTNNSRLTCKTAGTYQISLNAQFAANATGRREFFIYLNAATIIGSLQIPAVGGGAETSGNVSVLYSLAVNDYVEGLVVQDSGGALNILASSAHSPELMIVKVG